MRTPASIAGHPIHPMLVPIAIGCFVFSFAADIIHLVSGSPEPWNTLAFGTMIGGIIGALLAALFGITDLFSLPAGSTRSTAIAHGSLNVVIVVVYIVNAWLRHAQPESMQLPMILSLLTIIGLLVTGWLGGKLVFEHGVAVNRVPPPAPGD